MAYDGTHLALMNIGGKSARSVFVYTTTDAHTDVDATGYFTDGATRGMRVGDICYVAQVNSLSAPTSVTALTMHAVTAANTTTGIASIGAASTTAATVTVKADATAAPVVGDDTADGYSVGSLFIDVTNDAAYIAADVSAGAAVWLPTRNTALLSFSELSSKASDAAVARFVAPFKFKIVSVRTVLNAALATGDATFTTAIAGTGVTNGVVTATQSGSAAGDIDTATPTALNTGAAGALITVTGGGASTATATANVYVLIQEVL